MVRNSLDDILNDCVDRLQRGETLAMCLSRYPEHAGELRPLLETAVTIRASRPAPRAAFRAESRLRFQGAVRAQLARQTRSGRWSDRFATWGRAWAGATAALVLTLGLGGGAVFASTGANPDDPLYTVKRVGEQARLLVALSEASRAELHLELADRRGLELVTMAQAGKEEHLHRLRRDLIRELELANAHAGISMAGVVEAASDSVTMMQAAPERSVSDMRATASSPATPSSFSPASEWSDLDSTKKGSMPPASVAAPTQQPPREIKAVPTVRPTPVFQPENQGQAKFLRRAQEVTERNAARLKLAQRNVTPEAREALDRVLKFVDAHQATGNIPGDWEQRVVLIRGTIMMKDKAWWIGERKVEEAEGARVRGKLEAGKTIVVGGLLQTDGSLLALEIDARTKERGDARRIVVQGPVVLDERRNVTVGGYRVRVTHTQAQSLGRLESGNWVLVDGQIDGPQDIKASLVRPLDDAPTAFDDGDEAD